MIFIRYIHLTKEKAQLLLFGIVPHVDEKGEEPIGVSLDLRNVTKVLFVMVGETSLLMVEI